MRKRRCDYYPCHSIKKIDFDLFRKILFN
ncbi:hypothetical protein FJZ18_01270 [Candidatus Pacearchaeota archaeon]|nr:hypothetical protein [Candidatus Pacearchaeota archaeon]